MRGSRTSGICFSLLPWLFAATTGSLHAALPAGCTPLLNSNIGCDFYAVTLPNVFLDESTFSFGVDLLNTGNASVDATVTGAGLGSAQMFSVAAGSSTTKQLPWLPSLATTTATTKLVGAAYHITTSAPVAALQLNPTNYATVSSYSYSNDASLLLPVQSAGVAYRVVAWPTWNGGGTQYPGQVAVVATVAGTTVQVGAAGTIEAGAGLGANGGSVVLDQGDILLISSALDAPMDGNGSDLSGTLITSSAPVLVWTSHIGTFIPAGVAYADHVEEILPPVSALGSDYFVVRPGNPSGSMSGAANYVKVVGTVDGTAIQTDPGVAGAPSNLQAGQVATFEATVDFHLQSSHPVVVGVFMEGGGTPAFGGVGDPSESIVIPTSQARRAVDFLASTALTPEFAQLVAPTGASISVDGSPVSGWTAIGASSGYSAANVALCCTDVHHANGNRPFLLSVYSYPMYTSYWYPGSLGLGDGIFADGFQ